MTDSAKLYLVADIGGTNVRFALADADLQVTHIRRYACAAYAGPEEAAQAYLSDIGQPIPKFACFAVACPADTDPIQFTNSPWRFSPRQTAADLGLQQLHIVNDFTALAYAVPLLQADELCQIGGATPVAGCAKAIIGPGTGLGVSGLIPKDGGWSALSGEGGHVGFAPSNALEDRVLCHLRAQFGRVSAERILSGQGLCDLHRALQAVSGRPAPTAQSAQAIVAMAAAENGKPDAEEAGATLDVFCRILGSVAGDLALTLGARGGVYIGGGIVPHFQARFENSDFRAAFDAKGRFHDYVAAIPVWLITAETPALNGAAYAAHRLTAPQ